MGYLATNPKLMSKKQKRARHGIMVQYRPKLHIVQYSRGHKYRSPVQLVSWEIAVWGDVVGGGVAM